MLATIGRTADWLLERILPGTQAGACVPENGHVCYCKSHKLYRFNCIGHCVVNTSC